MSVYDTGLVPGDTPVLASEIKVGDTLRMFSGLHDSASVVQARKELTQWGKRYCIVLDNGLRMDLYERDVRHLATGGPRECQGE